MRLLGSGRRPVASGAEAPLGILVLPLGREVGGFEVAAQLCRSEARLKGRRHAMTGEGLLLQSAGGPAWRMDRQIPYHVNFVLWLKRHVGSSEPLTEGDWQQWLEQVVALQAVTGDQIADLAPGPGLRNLAVQHWLQFVREFDQDKRSLAQRLTQESTQARIQDIMRDSDECFTFLHTNHPGDFCWNVGGAWVLGEAYCDAQRIRSLVARLRNGKSGDGPTP